MSLSVALIVKNEERTLARCLDSFHAAVDEIVVVDTGSDDATKAIARRYTDCVYDYPWGNDFGAARQFAFNCARGDWVAWVDADDVVLGAERIRPMLSDASGDIGVFYWPYVVDRDERGNSCCEFWRERCVRNDGSFRWSGRIHEVLISQRSWQAVRMPDVAVEHRPEHHRGQDKLRRNLEILEAEYAENPDSPSPRLLFYLGRDYASAGEVRRALAMFQRYLRVATWDDERFLAQTKVAELYRVEQRYDLAIEADLQALKICPHWPGAHFGLAKTYYFLRDWHRVIHWTEVGRAMPLPETIHFLNPLDYRYNWIIYYTNALYHVGAVEEAQAWTRRALQICPDDPWHRQNFLVFSAALHPAEQVAGPSPRTARDSVSPPDRSRGARTDSPAPARSRPLRVVWEGPQFARSSYALVNRELCSALLRLDAEGASEPMEVSLDPHTWFDFGPEEDQANLDPLAARFHAPLSGPADVHVSLSGWQWANAEPPCEGRWIIYQPWEFTGLPRTWLDLFAHHVDEVWVPSRFVWQCFVDNGISPERVQVVHLGVRPDIFRPDIPPLPLSSRKSFKFLFLGGTIWRKGIDVLLDAYTQAFRREDDACLVIKDVGAGSYYREQNASERIRVLQADPRAPEIVYLTEDVPDREVARIYTACNCLVHPYRAEGFALPVAEAMACGLPVIVTQGGACDDYCTDQTAYWVPAELTPAPIWEETVRPSYVLEPSREALIERLRYVYEHREEARRKGELASTHVHANLTWERAARTVMERLAQVGNAPVCSAMPSGSSGDAMAEAQRAAAAETIGAAHG